MVDLEEYIARYAELGWSQMLIPPGQKKFTDQGWPTAPDDVAPMLRAVRAGGDWNLAVRLGERSGYLADVDLDSDAARTLAPVLLPATAAVFGRATAKDPTHRLYVCPDGPLGNGTVTLTGQCSLRWTGAYTVFPPSTHPDGSTYEWIPLALAQGPPAVGWSTLLDATREVAAGALLLGVYPQWQALRLRHYSTLALSAALLRAGWALPRVERFVYAVAVAAGDEEADARVTNARTTADRLARGEKLGGWSTLVSNAGADVVTRLQRFLGIDPYASGGDAWAGVVKAGNGSTSTPPTGGGSTPSTTPAAGAKGTNQAPGPPAAPVITTAQQAAQQAAAAKTVPLKDNQVALAVAQTLHSKIPVARDEGRQLYHYAGGVYRSRGTELYLRSVISAEVLRQYGDEYLDKRIEDEVLHRLLVGAGDIEARPDPWLLNLENGLLDLRTMVLSPHNPMLRTTLKLPVTYDPTATCPKVDQFCAQVFPQDAYDIGVPWEVIALCACPVTGVEKAVLLVGEGANGKSVYLELVQAFVGKENSSAVSLQKIGSNTFATADLRGKLLNRCSDLPSRKVEDSGDFKAIVSGETIRAERKGQPAFDFEPFCRLLFSANSPPESDDHSPGYVRRWHIIPFVRTFDPKTPTYRPRQELLDELRDPTEMSGLLNRVIPAMLHFLSGGPPHSSPSMDDAIDEWVELSDDFGIWLETQLKSDVSGFVASEEIAHRWGIRQERRHLPKLVTRHRIAKAMAARFPKAVKGQHRVGGSGSGINLPNGSTALGPQRRGYLGVSWRSGW
jgi:P4 family phage/plasmid primase-like protien